MSLNDACPGGQVAEPYLMAVGIHLGGLERAGPRQLSSLFGQAQEVNSREHADTLSPGIDQWGAANLMVAEDATCFPKRQFARQPDNGQGHQISGLQFEQRLGNGIHGSRTSDAGRE
jgi:hypothetical protein